MIIDNYRGVDIQKAFELTAFFSVFRQTHEAGFTFPGESHRFWEIVYVVSGSIQSIENTEVYELKEGDMILHAPMEFHSIRNHRDTPAKVLVTTFATAGTLPESLSGGIFALSAKERADFETLFRRLENFWAQHPSDGLDSLLCANQLSAFLIELAGSSSAQRMVSSHSALEYRRVIQAMNDNLYTNCTLTELAHQLSISVSYMKILFGRYGGISPKAYYSQLRCNEAVRLLQKGMSAAEVAEKMNFSSPNYFSTFMRRQTGSLPSQYGRESHEE